MTFTHPALTWLIKNDPDAALAVFHRLRDDYYSHGDEQQPSYLDPRERNADDAECFDVPDVGRTSETMSDSCLDGPDEIHGEMLHEEKPSTHVLLRSAGGVAWPWCGQRRKHDGKLIWTGEPWAYEYGLRPTIAGNHIIGLGGLTYNTAPSARPRSEGGMLMSFIDDQGSLQKPAYKATKPRGGKRPHRADPAGYLALRVTAPSPLTVCGYQRPMSGEPALIPMLTPTADCAANKTILAAAIANTNMATVTFTRYPDAIAKGARFIGGMTGRCQTVSAATVGKATSGVRLDDQTNEVLDEVASRGTLTSVGIKLGYSGGYADRAGGKAVLAAGRALLAANDNTAKKAAA